METERTELIILIETIKQNILHNPRKRVWEGIVLCNSKEYHWKVTEKDINADNKELQ